MTFYICTTGSECSNLGWKGPTTHSEQVRRARQDSRGLCGTPVSRAMLEKAASAGLQDGQFRSGSVLGQTPIEGSRPRGAITCLVSSLGRQSAAPAPTSCSGSLRTGALPRRPHRSRQNQQLPAGRGHPEWHISVAQRTRNSMPRRE